MDRRNPRSAEESKRSRYLDAVSSLSLVPASRDYPTEDGTGSYPFTGTETCSICLSVCSRLTVTVPCQHPFCMECISHWLWERRTCPLCRQAVQLTRFLITEPTSGRLVWRVAPYRRSPASYPYIIQTQNELLIETFADEDVYLFTPAFFRGRLHYRVLIIMENAHVIMSLPPVGSFLVPAQQLGIVVEELRSRNIPFYASARHMDGIRTHPPAFVSHPPH